MQVFFKDIQARMQAKWCMQAATEVSRKGTVFYVLCSLRIVATKMTK